MLHGSNLSRGEATSWQVIGLFNRKALYLMVKTMGFRLRCFPWTNPLFISPKSFRAVSKSGKAVVSSCWLTYDWKSSLDASEHLVAGRSSLCSRPCWLLWLPPWRIVNGFKLQVITILVSRGVDHPLSILILICTASTPQDIQGLPWCSMMYQDRSLSLT